MNPKAVRIAVAILALAMIARGIYQVSHALGFWP
jgi:hypothetical protein